MRLWSVLWHGRLWESLYAPAVSLNKFHSWTPKHGSAALAFKYLILSCLWGEGDVIYTLLTGWIVVETSSSAQESLFLSQCYSICLSLFIHYVHSCHGNSEWLWGAVSSHAWLAINPVLQLWQMMEKSSLKVIFIDCTIFFVAQLFCVAKCFLHQQV